MKKVTGFTLMEVILVIVIIGAVAAAGIVNYYKSNERADLEAVLSQLRLIHYAQRAYFLRNDEYYPKNGDGDQADLNIINEDLNLGLSSLDKFSFMCIDTKDPDTFDCRAERDDDAYYVQVTEADLDDANPACVPDTGSCP